MNKSFEIKELEVKAGNKDFDVLVEIDGKQLYIEVTNPREYLPLRLFDGAYRVPDKIISKIKDKYEKFSGLADCDIAILAITHMPSFTVESDIKRAFCIGLKENQKFERLSAVLLFDSLSCRLICNKNAKNPIPKHISEKLDPNVNELRFKPALKRLPIENAASNFQTPAYLQAARITI